MLGALVLCSPSEHAFCCTLLTLQCACVNELHTLREASEEPCSSVLQFCSDLILLMAETLSGVYTDLPMDFPGGTEGKPSAYNAGDLGSIPGLGRSPGEENGNPFQCSCLQNPMDGGAC